MKSMKLKIFIIMNIILNIKEYYYTKKGGGLGGYLRFCYILPISSKEIFIKKVEKRRLLFPKGVERGGGQSLGDMFPKSPSFLLPPVEPHPPGAPVSCTQSSAKSGSQFNLSKETSQYIYIFFLSYMVP